MLGIKDNACIMGFLDMKIAIKLGKFMILILISFVKMKKLCNWWHHFSWTDEIFKLFLKYLSSKLNLYWLLEKHSPNLNSWIMQITLTLKRGGDNGDVGESNPLWRLRELMKISLISSLSQPNFLSYCPMLR